MPHLFSPSREIRYYNMCLPGSLSRWEQLQSRLFPSPPALGHQHVLLFQLLSSIIFLLKRYMNLFIFSFMLFCAVERTCRVSELARPRMPAGHTCCVGVEGTQRHASGGRGHVLLRNSWARRREPAGFRSGEPLGFGGRTRRVSAFMNADLWNLIGKTLF